MKLEEVILRDTRTNQPAADASNNGWLYYVTDEGVLERSNGSAWETYAQGNTFYIGYGRGYSPEGLANTIKYTDDGAWDSEEDVETIVGNIIPTAGILHTFYVDASSNTLDAGNAVFTVIKNGVATTITKTVAFGVASITADTTHSVVVAAGDRISFKADIGGTTGNIKYGLSVLFQSTV